MFESLQGLAAVCDSLIGKFFVLRQSIGQLHPGLFRGGVDMHFRFDPARVIEASHLQEHIAGIGIAFEIYT